MMNVVVEKKRLLQDLGHLQVVLREYQTFVQGMDPGEEWNEKALEMIRSHQAYLHKAKVTLKTLDLVHALLRKVLNRLPVDKISLSGLDELGQDILSAVSTKQGETEEPLDELIAQLNTLARNAPLAQQEKIRYLLISLQKFFNELEKEKLLNLDESLTQINLLTSNLESQQLVREIAMIAREIYNALTTFTDGLQLDSLNQTTDGISEAVKKLKTVIKKLEEAAFHNLESLETIIQDNQESQNHLEKTLRGLRSAQNKLGEVKKENKALVDAVSRIQDKLGDGIGASMMVLQTRAHLNQDTYMTMMANQGFQDLTGQALKKIITFIESLELQMVKLLNKYRPVLGIIHPPVGGAKARKENQAAPDTQSQDQVDDLLSSLGF